MKVFYFPLLAKSWFLTWTFYKNSKNQYQQLPLDQNHWICKFMTSRYHNGVSICCGQLCVWEERRYSLYEGQTAISKFLYFRIILTDIAIQLIFAMFFSGKLIYTHIHGCGPKDIWSNHTKKFAHWLKCDFGAKQNIAYYSCYSCQILL